LLDLNVVALRRDLDDDGPIASGHVRDPRSASGVVSLKVGTTRGTHTRSEIESGCRQTSGIRTWSGMLQPVHAAMSPDWLRSRAISVTHLSLSGSAL